jgi:hypothetical protein
MRIELTEEWLYTDLRDYFLRLGAEVVRTDEGAIEVNFADGILREDESTEMYLQTWARYRRVEARVVGATVSVQTATALEASSQPPASRATPPLRLGELLLSKGLINEDQLSRALVESRQTGETLGRVLIRNGAVFESELARVLGEQWSIPYVNLALIGVDRSALALLPREVGIRNAAVPVRFDNGELRVAFADPSDTEAVGAVQGFVSMPIQPAIAELSDIDTVWRSVAA